MLSEAKECPSFYITQWWRRQGSRIHRCSATTISKRSSVARKCQHLLPALLPKFSQVHQLIKTLSTVLSTLNEVRAVYDKVLLLQKHYYYL